jgi:hypothetical protein
MLQLDEGHRVVHGVHRQHWHRNAARGVGVVRKPRHRLRVGGIAGHAGIQRAVIV